MAGKRRHWKEKDGRFWARISIPVALRPRFENKTQLTEALGGDLKVADRNHAAAVARLQAMIEAARGRIASTDQTRPASNPTTLTDHDLEGLAWSHYAKTLKAIQLNRMAMPTPGEIEAEFEAAMQRIEAGEASPDKGITAPFNYATDYELKAGARHFDRNLRTRRLAALRAAIPAGETKLVDASVSQFVSENMLNVIPGSREWLNLALIFIRAEIEALERSVEFDAGDMTGVIGDPLIKPPEKRGGITKPLPLRELFEDYIASRNAVGTHIDGGQNWRKSIKRLIDHLGHEDARRITKRNLLDWRDAMLSEGLSAKTIADKHLAALRAILSWAFENDHLPTNEMATVTQDAPKKVQSREKGYTDQEALEVIKFSLSHEPDLRTNA
jgi:hypothetical protein